MPGHIFFVCGHANWGKSMTLRHLTGSKDKKWVRVAGADFWVRKMSNDDRPGDYMERMGRLDPESDPWVIAALCPAFNDPEADPSGLLKGLRDRGYNLHFWVIEHQYDGSDVVSADEVSRLRELGEVVVFSPVSEAEDRAQAVLAFIQSRVVTGAPGMSPNP